MSNLNTLTIVFVAVMLFTSCNTPNNKKDSNIHESKEEQTKAVTSTSYNTDEILSYAMDGLFDKVKEAIEGGFNPNSTDEFKRTALLMASYNGHTDIVKYLIEKGADVNHTDTVHRTALMYASTGPFVPTVMTLLEAGAKPNITDNEENWTAVMMAASEGQLDVIKALVAFGADLKMVLLNQKDTLK